jgi:REP element-mobilizing transposase RayT
MNDVRTYLITFRTYGSWLPGDNRGWVSRGHNRPRIARRTSNATRWAAAKRRMRHQTVILTPPQRAVCTEEIIRTCRFRGWHLPALNARTNHVHMVLATAADPDDAMAECKAYATRALRNSGLMPPVAAVWAERGSVETLPTPEAVEAACRYVIEGQGGTPGCAGEDGH